MEVWDKIIAVNLTGPMRLIKAVAPVMKAQGSGRIVNISSVAGVGPTGSSIAYAVSKAGLIHLTQLHGGGPGARDTGQLRGARPPGGHAGDRQSAARIHRGTRQPPRCSKNPPTRTIAPTWWLRCAAPRR